MTSPMKEARLQGRVNKFEKMFRLSQNSNSESAIMEHMQGLWQLHMLQRLIEVICKSQAAKTLEINMFQALPKVGTKSHAFNITWKCHTIQGLIEVVPKEQVLQAAWEVYLLQALVEIMAEA